MDFCQLERNIYVKCNGNVPPKAPRRMKDAADTSLRYAQLERLTDTCMVLAQQAEI